MSLAWASHQRTCLLSYTCYLVVHLCRLWLLTNGINDVIACYRSSHSTLLRRVTRHTVLVRLGRGQVSRRVEPLSEGFGCDRVQYGAAYRRLRCGVHVRRPSFPGVLHAGYSSTTPFLLSVLAIPRVTVCMLLRLLIVFEYGGVKIDHQVG